MKATAAAFVAGWGLVLALAGLVLWVYGGGVFVVGQFLGASLITETVAGATALSGARKRQAPSRSPYRAGAGESLVAAFGIALACLGLTYTWLAAAAVLPLVLAGYLHVLHLRRERARR